MRLLMLCGDKYHPAENMHRALSWLEAHDFQPDWRELVNDELAEGPTAYPLVVLAKSNHTSVEDDRPWMTAATQASFVNYVRQGGGLLAVHSGIAGYDACLALRRLLGGVFTHHPDQCPVTVTPRPEHPLAEGSSPFTLQDEHYFVAMDDPQTDVFLTTTSEHGRQPAGWVRFEGKGRVAVLTPGHNLPVWQHPAYLKLVANAIHWAAGQAGAQTTDG